MYIWIFLATIMVALSFYNLSPRSDVDNYVTEVKASIPVNRFRAEHTAFIRTMECEVMMRTDNGSWRNTNTSKPNDIYVENMNNLPYTDYASNLPVGYEQSSSLLNVRHVIVCTKGKLEDPESTEFTDCRTTSYRYGISYARIPDRWMAKKEDDKGAIKPLPALVNLLARASGAGSIYGWTDCYNSQCYLRGYSTGVLAAEQEGDDIVVKNRSLPANSPVWQMDDFKSQCTTSITNPCLVAYDRFLTADKGHHCKTLMGDSYPYSSQD